MNYIPGFSNHLQQFARGGPARYAGEDIYGDTFEPAFDGGGAYEQFIAPPAENVYQPAVEPMTLRAAPSESVYQPAVQPMTTEAAPFDYSNLDFSGLDLSGLDSLYGMNFGSNFGGGPMGGAYQADPNLQYIGAPLSNKGNPTSQTGGNTFAVRADQPVRLVDHRTNQVVFEGTGFDAAREASKLGQGMTDQYGRKANYSIQTADPTGNYSTVAYEKKNKSTLGQIANVAGTVLPLAMIPLTMGASALVSGIPNIIALGAGLGGAGAALKGDNILKGAAMGGLSAAGGQLLGPALGAGGAFGTELAPKLATAIGTGLGSTAGGLATGQSLKNSLLGGVASGALSYITPDIAKGLGIGQGPSPSASTGSADSSVAYGGPNAEIIVSATTPFSTPNINLGGFKTPAQKYANDLATGSISDPNTGLPYSNGYDGDIINVTGSVPGAVTGGLNLGGLTANPPANVTDEIVVTGQRPSAVSAPVTGGLSPDVLAGLAEFEKNPIISEGSKIERPTSVSPDVLAGLAEFEKNPIISEGSKIERPTPVPVPITGVSPVDPIYGEIVVDAPKAITKEDGLPDGSVVGGLPIMGLPTPDPALTGEGDKKLGVEEYLRIAGLLSGLVGGAAGGGNQGPAGTYNTGGRGLNPMFSAKLPTANIPGGVGTPSNFAARPMGEEDWLTYAERPERSFFNYVPEPTGMAEGGSMAAKRGGASQRTEFAVKGPGTGRSDDIPAVLSDGEYVIDAETVALLGDGSSKAGAKKLDDLRVKVRKHKGKKLAKGRFSANAKRPEAYLSGGRI